MNKQDRDRIRAIQDKVIASAKCTGLPDDYKTNMRDSSGHDITVGDLRKYVYPQFEQVFLDYIRD